MSILKPEPSTQGASITLTQVLQLGITTILILDYSFFLSQQGTQGSANTLQLAAAEYGRSGTSTAVQKAVEDVLSQDHGDEKELCKMILDITLQNRMSKVAKE
ncbi:hypothetical protein K503DRAFT_771555 [Rhizopogon vinicolor AM-OR11-026]|uniref:Uncharacterized protein n=1 Tax=Rhizopogon vinicolor AM-OR11-026 TaxID=1314800 RepID=A0A1B7MXN3_9AGAM|nr:hypothetical protein K503DRAFT_771555 [Rhizopogon vinicolor AM-OR11-026]